MAFFRLRDEMATEGANSDPTLFDEDTFKSLILAQPGPISNQDAYVGPWCWC